MLEPDSPWRRIVSLSSGAKAGAAAVVGSLALGGIAAAATGVVPTGPLQGVADFLGVSTSSVSASESVEPSETASSSETAEPSESESTSTTGSTAPPTDLAAGLATTTATATYSPTSGPNPLGPAAWGLCHAFGNKTWGNGAVATPTSTESPNPDGRKSDNPSVAYANLKAAAGSLGMTVDSFCTYVIANHAVPTASATSTATGGSSLAPTDAPASTAPSMTARGHGHGQAGQHGKAKGLNRG